MPRIKSILKFFLLTLLVLTISCASPRRVQSFNSQYQGIYLEQFSLTYVRQLLLKSYNNSNAVKEVIGTDHSGFTEPILSLEDYKLIDSLTTMDNQHLIADSIEGSRRAEGSDGKRPLSYIMEKTKSKWLDSLAKRRLKINGIPKSWAD